MENRPDINFFGFLGLETGLGEAARNNIQALRTVGYQVKEYDVTVFNPDLKIKKTGINIFQVNPDNLYECLLKYKPDVMDGDYNIAFWAWETEEYPDQYVKYFGYFNEIWTPSSYCQNVISKKSPIPVLSMPHAVPLEAPLVRVKDLRAKVIADRKNSFVFAFFFDYKSQITRKNVLGLIDSFRIAFGENNEDVSLLLKTYPSEYHQEERETIIEKIGSDSSIILFEEKLERTDLQHLISEIDCYVSLHHSEGFGLTMAEAMGLGKPVIATAYSGNMEYMNVNNALLVKYSMTYLTEPVGPFLAGSIWAEPDLNHAAQLMKNVALKKQSFDKLTGLAKEEMLKKYNMHCVGESMHDRINIISKIISFQNKETVKDIISHLQLENDLMNLKLSKIKDIGYIKLKLKFKNIKNALLGKNKKYLWE